MTEQVNDRCHTCGQTRAWHHHNQPRHAFNNGELPASDTFGKRLPDGTRVTPSATEPVVVTESPWPFDPVLRQALINKGLLTPEDLVAAERTIRAVTATFQKEGTHVPSTGGPDEAHV